MQENTLYTRWLTLSTFSKCDWVQLHNLAGWATRNSWLMTWVRCSAFHGKIIFPWQCSLLFLSESHSHFLLSHQILYTNTFPFTLGGWLDLSLSWENSCSEGHPSKTCSISETPYTFTHFVSFLLVSQEKALFSGVRPLAPVGSQYFLLLHILFKFWPSHFSHLGRVLWSSLTPALLSWTRSLPSCPIFKVPKACVGAGEDSWESLGLQGDPASPS